MEKLILRWFYAAIAVADQFPGNDNTVAIWRFQDGAILLLPTIGHAATFSTIGPAERGVVSERRSCEEQGNDKDLVAYG